jgi:hypothetical protein
MYLTFIQKLSKAPYRMKQILFFTAIIIITIFSSCKDETESINEVVNSTWALSSMQYEDSTGTIKVISDSDASLTFNFESIESTNLGYQVTGSDTLNFEYALYSDCCNLMFERSDIKKMPIDAIGRVQVYDFHKISKKKVEFSIGQEYDYTTGELYKNVSYLYTKVK